ncbi:glycosyltransferase [Nonomuraea sp. NPDC046570]|uniref:glycosyltransferase n=1 Tax=Nonomuraea sp. NPDC046570 TaxID=3155255 RepID=UPI0033C05173
MPPSAQRPKLAVIVGNGITGDSRVQKTALAAARDGWDVTLVGRTGRTEPEYSTFGPVKVIRVPVRGEARQHQLTRRRLRATRSVVTQWRLPDEKALTGLRAFHKAWTRQQTARIGWTYDHGGPRGRLSRAGRRAVIAVARKVLRLRVRTFQWERRRHRKAKARVPSGDWRRDMPELLDLDLAFGPVLEALRPDVIHANDITMIGVAAHAAARLRAKGRRCRWIYDAHEYVQGVEWRSELKSSGYVAHEKAFIGRADAVVTVSPEIAEILRRSHGLPSLPLVVRNTPIREAIGAPGRASVRERCGLAAEVPLLVYAGWIDAQRGVDTAVQALAELPGVHLALVSNRHDATMEELLATAALHEVQDRVHVVPYVPQAEVADYLSSADLGLVCLRRVPNHELSLPTKLAEYLHAGLPVVGADVRTLRGYVRAHDLGELYLPGDPSSFARAVTAALYRRGELAANITEGVLKELSWEQQCAGLLQLYRDLSGLVPPRPQEVPWDVRERRVQKDKPRGAGWTMLTGTPVRLGLGPANYAGQLAAIAQALDRRRSDISIEVVMRKRPGSAFDYPSDVHLDPSRLGRLDGQVEQVRRAIGRYTHLIADAFLPFFGKLNGDHIGADLPALANAGIKVALLAHGSEIRHPGRHMAAYEYSLFHDAPAGHAARLAAIVERNQRVARECGLPIFVTTPDLLADVPWAVWTPLVVDVDAWTCDGPVLERRRPVVLHAPSKRWTKGTDHILPVLTDLHERGAIEFQLAEKVAWSQMPHLVKNADIIVDQFVIGTYGTFACEGMAAGKPVVAFLSEEAGEAAGVTPPIVNATPATLGEAMARLLDDRAEARRIGRESALFARTYHDGTWTAQTLEGFLQ